MDLNFLKHLKHLKPDEGYTSVSRQEILSSVRPAAVPRLSPWQVIVQSLQYGSAVALASVLLVLVLGGFSSWQLLSPFRMASLDPRSLRAEAQAIDVQFEMTNIKYPEPQARAMSLSSEPEEKTPAKQQAEEEAKNLGLVPATSSTEEPTLDEALELLAE